MEPLVLAFIIICLLLLLIWPPFIIIILAILFSLAYLVYRHALNPPICTWVFGDDPHREILLSVRKIGEKSMPSPILEVRAIDAPSHQENYRIEEENSSNFIHETPYWAMRFKIQNLEAGQKYKYKIVEQGDGSLLAAGTFQTLPHEFSPFRVALFGDIQAGDTAAVLESYMFFLVRRVRPSLLVCMGDLVHFYNNPKYWNVFFQVMRKLVPYTPFYTTPGNHCGGKDLGETSKNLLLAPQNRWHYSFSYQNTLFLTINSLLWDKQDEAAQYEWLVSELKKKRHLHTFCVFWAHIPAIGPPYSKDGRLSPAEEYIQGKIHPLLDQYDVDLAFFGHKHAYIREGNKIVTASIHGVRDYEECDGPVYKLQNRHHFCVLEITEKKMIMQARSWFGTVMDEVIIEKCLSD